MTTWSQPESRRTTCRVVEFPLRRMEPRWVDSLEFSEERAETEKTEKGEQNEEATSILLGR